MTRHDIICGDCLTTLRDMEACSVHCCVTSPPYWGLRDYGTATWEGGDEACDHVAQTMRTRESLAAWSAENAAGGGHAVPESVQYRNVCGKCGARRIDAQLGLEPTYQEYVQHMVEVFREVRRVLRDDGTLWLNLGDSYASGEVGRHDQKSGAYLTRPDGKGIKKGVGEHRQHYKRPDSLKPKDLVGIPWRVAFALQEDGWYLRQDIIWHKPNPMPESVTDRCTKAHEYIFLLAKSQRYYYDAEAIAEPVAYESGGACFGKVEKDGPGSRRISADDNARIRSGTRNKRSVWTVTTKPYKAAHFATFPPKLIEPCILAGCPEGGTVLDPFNGSGTTGAVCQQLGRSSIGIELNPSYCQLAKKRLQQPCIF